MVKYFFEFLTELDHFKQKIKSAIMTSFTPFPPRKKVR